MLCIGWQALLQRRAQRVWLLRDGSRDFFHELAKFAKVAAAGVGEANGTNNLAVLRQDERQRCLPVQRVATWSIDPVDADDDRSSQLHRCRAALDGSFCIVAICCDANQVRLQARPGKLYPELIETGDHRRGVARQCIHEQERRRCHADLRRGIELFACERAGGGVDSARRQLGSGWGPASKCFRVGATTLFGRSLCLGILCLRRLGRRGCRLPRSNHTHDDHDQADGIRS